MLVTRTYMYFCRRFNGYVCLKFICDMWRKFLVQILNKLYALLASHCLLSESIVIKWLRKYVVTIIRIDKNRDEFNSSVSNKMQLWKLLTAGRQVKCVPLLHLNPVLIIRGALPPCLHEWRRDSFIFYQNLYGLKCHYSWQAGWLRIDSW